MIGRTLTDVRSELESLATADGRYCIRCGRTGQRPVPVDGRRFPDRATAVEAVRLAHAYRATLRRYDPRAPWYDFVVCEAPDGRTTGGRDWSAPSTDGAYSQTLVAYCHDLAGAVFEALSASDHDAIERSVMDAYLDAAEETADRDRLCLQLLATMATELTTHLSGESQAEILQCATAHLPAAPTSPTPLAAGLDHLRTVGLLDEFRVVDDSRGRPGEVVLSGYELPPVDGSLPTIPLTVETARRESSRGPVVTDARSRGDGRWHVVLSTTGPGLSGASVRIDG